MTTLTRFRLSGSDRLSNFAVASTLLAIFLSLLGCSKREKVTFDPPINLIATELSVRPDSDGLSTPSEIQATKAFIVTGTFVSKSLLRNKVMIRALDVSAPDKPITMQSGIANVAAKGDDQFSYMAHVRGIRQAGKYEVQVLYGTKVVDKVDIVVTELPDQG